MIMIHQTYLFVERVDSIGGRKVDRTARLLFRSDEERYWRRRDRRCALLLRELRCAANTLSNW